MDAVLSIRQGKGRSILRTENRPRPFIWPPSSQVPASCSHWWPYPYVYWPWLHQSCRKCNNEGCPDMSWSGVKVGVLVLHTVWAVCDCVHLHTLAWNIMYHLIIFLSKSFCLLPAFNKRWWPSQAWHNPYAVVLVIPKLKGENKWLPWTD